MTQCSVYPREIVRAAGVRRDVVFVHESGVESGHERAAVLDVELQQIGFPAREQAQRRGKHDFVAGQILRGPGEIDRDVAIMQGRVEKLDVVPIGEGRVRLLGGDE